MHETLKVNCPLNYATSELCCQFCIYLILAEVLSLTESKHLYIFFLIIINICVPVLILFINHSTDKVSEFVLC